MSTIPMSHTESKAADAAGQFDWREQPYNDREVGPIERVQLPTEMVTVLHGIVFDLDLDLIPEDAPDVAAGEGPGRFSEMTLAAWLARHPALAGAEVRDTGRNLHVLLWLEKPVAFATDGERRRWDGIARAVQAALPVDPDQPGLTALTRPVGSINSRTGRAVATLRPGSPVPVAAVLELYASMARAPFRTVAGILLGGDRVTPCPVCRAEGSSLAALETTGRCYGSCGTVRLERLYDVFLAPRTPRGGEGRDGQA